MAKPNDTYAASVDIATEAESVLIITADDTQDLEFFYPYYRFIEAGYHVHVATPKGGEFKGKQGMGLKETKAIKDVFPEMYDMIYIPGGKAPAELKKNKEVLEFVKTFAARGKPISAICHGPQVLAAAGIIQGKNIAAWPEVQKEIEEAGATYVDEPAIVDGQFITARWPGDLPSHMKRTLEALQGKAPRVAFQGPRVVTG